MTSYDNKAREKIRVEFAKQRRKGCSVAESIRLAGISASTYYAWNEGSQWSTIGGWKSGGTRKGGTPKGGTSKGGTSKGGGTTRRRATGRNGTVR